MMGVIVCLIISILAKITAADETMTQPFPVYRMKEVKFTGGVAGATNEYSNDWRAELAFIPQTPVEKGWHTGPKSGPALNLPVMIWYDFKSDGVRPSEVSFQPAQKEVTKSPTSYQFVGSNDAVCNDDSVWTILCEDLSDRTWRNDWEVKYCKVKPEITEKFRCLGIRILANRHKDGWTHARNIRVWEKIGLF